MCNKCNDTGRIGESYCSCPRGNAQRLKADFNAKKSVDKPDLAKHYSGFDLMK